MSPVGGSLPEELLGLLDALAHSPDPVFVTDRHNRIVFWNRSCERLFGYPEDEVIGQSCASLLRGCDVHGNRYCSERCPIQQISARGETVRHFDIQFTAKDGQGVAADVNILHLTLPSPEHFVLAHILKPTEPARPRLEPGPEPPPRPTLVAVKESPDARARRLTAREVEVLGMLAAGRTTPEIAERLHISTLTARNHIQNILEKLEVHSKAEAVAFAFQKRIF